MQFEVILLEYILSGSKNIAIVKVTQVLKNSFLACQSRNSLNFNLRFECTSKKNCHMIGQVYKKIACFVVFIFVVTDYMTS